MERYDDDIGAAKSPRRVRTREGGATRGAVQTQGPARWSVHPGSNTDAAAAISDKARGKNPGCVSSFLSLDWTGPFTPGNPTDETTRREDDNDAASRTQKTNEVCISFLWLRRIDDALWVLPRGAGECQSVMSHLVISCWWLLLWHTCVRLVFCRYMNLRRPPEGYISILSSARVPSLSLLSVGQWFSGPALVPTQPLPESKRRWQGFCHVMLQQRRIP